MHSYILDLEAMLEILRTRRQSTGLWTLDETLPGMDWGIGGRLAKTIGVPWTYIYP